MRRAWIGVLCLWALSGCGGVAESQKESPGEVAHVDAAAPPGGDGSEAAPFQGLEAALAAGRARVRLSPGAYVMPASWSFGDTVSVEGDGDGEALLVGAGAVVWEATQGVSLRGVTVNGALELRGDWSLEEVEVRGASGALVAQGGAEVSLRRVSFAEGGGLRLRQVQVARLEEITLEGTRGGVLVEDVGALTWTNGALRGVLGPGVSLLRSTGTLKEVNVHGTRQEGEVGGDGIVAQESALVIEGGSVLDSADRGVIYRDATGRLVGVSLREAVRPLLSVTEGAVVEAEALSIGPGGACVFVAGGTLRASGQTIQSCGTGILVSQGSALTLEDSTVRGCAGGAISLNGAGIKAEVRRSTLEGSAQTCVSVSNTQEEVVLEGNTIRDCQGQGIGALLSGGLVIRGNQISAVAPDPVFQVADGIGLVDSGARIEGNTIEAVQGRGVGLLRSTAVAQDNTIRGAEEGGISVVDPHPTPATLRRNHIEDVRAVGILIFGAQAEVEGNEVLMTRLKPADGLGDGIVFGEGAEVTVAGNTLGGGALNGLVFFGGARGTVRGNTFSGNGHYGVREHCLGDLNMVTIENDNVFSGNTLGEIARCQ